MANPPRFAATGTPRWVKVSGIIAFILIVLVVIAHLFGHGLSGHMGHSGD